MMNDSNLFGANTHNIKVDLLQPKWQARCDKIHKLGLTKRLTQGITLVYCNVKYASLTPLTHSSFKSGLTNSYRVKILL